MSSHSPWWVRRKPVWTVATVTFPLFAACLSKLDKLEPSASTADSSPTAPQSTSSTAESETTTPSVEVLSSSGQAATTASAESSETDDSVTTGVSSTPLPTTETGVASATNMDAGGTAGVSSTQLSAESNISAGPTTPTPSSMDETLSSVDTGTTNADSAPTFFSAVDGLLVWLDAADDASFGAGAAVAAWSDRSGNDHHLSQAVTSGQPARVADGIGGLPVVRFDGIDDTLATAATLVNRAFHGFVVWQSSRVPPTTKSTLLCNSRNFEVNHGHVSEAARAGVSTCAGANCYTTNSGWYDAKFQKGLAAATAYSWQFSFAEASADLIAEAWGGLPVTQSNPTELPVAPAAPFHVGNCDAANCAFQGDVGEIVLFDRTLTSDEQARAASYLAAKWSLQEPAN